MDWIAVGWIGWPYGGLDGIRVDWVTVGWIGWL